MSGSTSLHVITNPRVRRSGLTSLLLNAAKLEESREEDVTFKYPVRLRVLFFLIIIIMAGEQLLSQP